MKKHRITIVKLSFLFIWVLFIQYYLMDETRHAQLREKKYLEIEYSGIVQDKRIDYRNHASRMVKLESGEITIPPGAYFLYDSIMIGDKMKKDSGDLKGYIFSRDTVIILDYENYLYYPEEEE